MKKITTNNKQQATLIRLFRRVVSPVILLMIFNISAYKSDAQIAPIETFKGKQHGNFSEIDPTSSVESDPTSSVQTDPTFSVQTDPT